MEWCSERDVVEAYGMGMEVGFRGWRNMRFGRLEVLRAEADGDV